MQKCNIELFYRKAVIFILKLTLIFKTNFSIKCIICKYIIKCLSLQQSSKYSVLQCLVQMSLDSYGLTLYIYNASIA
jgi:hypothetical protein